MCHGKSLRTVLWGAVVEKEAASADLEVGNRHSVGRSRCSGGQCALTKLCALTAIAADFVAGVSARIFTRRLARKSWRQRWGDGNAAWATIGAVSGEDAVTILCAFAAITADAVGEEGDVSPTSAGCHA